MIRHLSTLGQLETKWTQHLFTMQMHCNSLQMQTKIDTVASYAYGMTGLGPLPSWQLKFGFSVLIKTDHQPKQQRSEYMEMLINKFPFCKLPKITQKIGSQQINGELQERWLAFSSLLIFSDKQQELREVEQKLFQRSSYGDFDSEPKQELNGRSIFTDFYLAKLKQFVAKLNDSYDNLSHKQKLFIFQVFSQLQNRDEVKEFLDQFEEEILIRSGEVDLMSLWAKAKCVQEQFCTDLLNEIYIKISFKQEPGKESSILERLQTNEVSEERCLEAAKYLVTIPEPEKNLSSKILDECIGIFIRHQAKITPLEHWVIIKHIFFYSSAVCSEYAEMLKSQILQACQSNLGNALHVPLVLKLIKYRSKLRLSNAEFYGVFSANPQKYNTVFRQSRLNKEIFLDVMTKGNKTAINDEVRDEYSGFLLNKFQDYQKRSELEEEEITRNIKLLLKYGRDLKGIELKTILDIICKDLYPKFQDSASPELKHYFVLSVFTFVSPQFFKQNEQALRQMAQQVIDHQYEMCAQSSPTKVQQQVEMNRIIELMSAVNKSYIQPSLTRNVFAEEFDKFRLPLKSAKSYIKLLKYTDYPTVDKARAIQKHRQVFYNFIDFASENEGNLRSFKLFYLFVGVLDDCNIDDKVMYMKIEKLFCRHLMKESSGSQVAKHLPTRSDLIFLSRKMGEKNRASQRLLEFLQKTIRNYGKLRENVQEYIEAQQNIEAMRHNRNRNRSQGKRRNDRSKRDY